MHRCTSRETAELRQEEINRSRALASLLISLDVPYAKQWQPILVSCQAAAFATASTGWTINYRDAAYGYVWSWLENLAPYVGASLDVMEADTNRMRPQRHWVFTNLKKGEGVDKIVDFIITKGMLAEVREE